MATPAAGGKAGPKRKRKRSSSTGGSDSATTAAPPNPAAASAAAASASGLDRSKIPRGPERFKYQSEIANMMFAHGDARKPEPESVRLMEDVVRQQVIGLLSESAKQTRERGARQIVIDDLLFICRKDKLKLHRLTEHLTRKQMAKREDAARHKRRQMLIWRWDYLSELNDLTSECPLPPVTSVMASVQQALQDADQRTRDMSKELYQEYAECRNLSFTVDKRMKKFREWISMSAYTDLKVKEEVVEALGFLALDCVVQLVQAALVIKEETKPPSRKSKAGTNPKEPSAAAAGQEPLEPWHLQEAFQRLSTVPRSMRLFQGGRATDPHFMRLLST